MKNYNIEIDKYENYVGRKGQWILSIGFVFILFFMMIFIIIVQDKDFSENENRTLKTFVPPSTKNVVDGSFMGNFEEYLADQFPERDSWVGIKTFSEKAVLKKDNGSVLFGKDGRLFSKAKHDEIQLEKNLDYIKAFVRKIDDRNEVKVSILIAPTAISVKAEELPRFSIVPDENNITKKLKENLAEGGNIIDVISEIRKYEGGDTYYKTDHHWTSRGAYAAYKAWALACGIRPKEESDFYIEKVSEDFLGTLHSKANIGERNSDIIEKYVPKEKKTYMINGEKRSLYYDGFLEKKDKYGYFLGGNAPVITIETENEEGTLLVIKDSYANSFIPFLTEHFHKIIVQDLRYEKTSPSEIIDREDVTDVLILYNAENFANDRNLVFLK